jgi:hypothetical protein
MLTLHTRIGGGALALAGLMMMAATPAAAGQLYRWTTSDGTVAYSDDAKRVPKAYRASAARTTVGELGSYARFTPSDDGAQARYAERLEGRLARLRAFNATEAPVATPTAGAQHPVSGMDLRSSRRVSERRFVGFDRAGRRVYRRTDRMRSLDQPIPSVALPVDPNDPAPVIIERRRVLDGDTNITRHVTVVEQGGRVLSVIKPRVHGGPVYSGTEEDLER